MTNPTNQPSKILDEVTTIPEKIYRKLLKPMKQPSKVFVLAKCVGCGNKRKIFAGEVKKGDQPMCDKCFMPMVAVSAEAKPMKQQNMSTKNKDMSSNMSSVESRFEKKFNYFLDGIPVSLSQSASDVILAFIKAELKANDKKWRARIRKAFYNFNDKEKDFECNQRTLKLRNNLLQEKE